MSYKACGDSEKNCTVYDYENKRRIGPVWVFFVILSMVLTSSLVCLRIYGLSLDSRFDYISAQAASVERALADLDKKVLSMGSPSAVYSYACEHLGMSEVAVAGVIKVRSNAGGEMASLGRDEWKNGWSGALPVSSNLDVETGLR